MVYHDLRQESDTSVKYTTMVYDCSKQERDISAYWINGLASLNKKVMHLLYIRQWFIIVLSKKVMRQLNLHRLLISFFYNIGLKKMIHKPYLHQRFTIILSR